VREPDADPNCNLKNRQEWAARACFASANLPALFLPSFPCTMISSHPEPSLLASVDALSNSSWPHNPPRNGFQSQEGAEVFGSHVSHL
jgi:hypothetical protein